ncbi:MAG: MATE family efflux transporter [Gammaproteobacteria bacterium]
MNKRTDNPPVSGLLPATETPQGSGQAPTLRLNLLPAQRFDAAGRAHVDLRAVFALALPLVANSAVQMLLNLTDIWFIGHISTSALAGVGAVQWLVLVVVFILGGIGLAVQTVVAQEYGARRFVRASQALWIALWGILFVTPLFVLAGLGGHWMLAPFGFDPKIETLAADFWLPRVAGSCFGAASWAVMGFFNGIGRPRMTVLITVVVALINALLNYLFIFKWGWGVAGSGWATTVAQALALGLGIALMFSREYRRTYKFRLTWRPRAHRLWRQFRLGFPMGLLYAADLMGVAVFQMMQVRLSTADGAATQVVMILTSVAYLPGFGIALAGTTLVGQSIGAGDRNWAMRVGTRVTLFTALYMGAAGLLLALTGEWVLPWFASAHDADAVAMLTVGTNILWLAAIYQFFDGMNLGSGMCLRGAGDAIVPAALVLVLSWLVFVPLAHALTFAPGQGWFDLSFLPQLGWGAVGGWTALLIYMVLLGMTLFMRWRSGAWQRIRI